MIFAAFEPRKLVCREPRIAWFWFWGYHGYWPILTHTWWARIWWLNEFHGLQGPQISFIDRKSLSFDSVCATVTDGLGMRRHPNLSKSADWCSALCKNVLVLLAIPAIPAIPSMVPGRNPSEANTSDFFSSRSPRLLMNSPGMPQREGPGRAIVGSFGGHKKIMVDPVSRWFQSIDVLFPLVD